VSDLVDVQNSLVSLCTAQLYPTGSSAGLVPSPAVGFVVKIYPGWPVKAQLDIDLAAKPAICHVSVYPTKMERQTTRYLSRYKQLSMNTPTLTLAASGQTVTVGGTIPPASNPHNLAIFVNGVPYIYQPLINDTLQTIATAFAALIPGASAAGAVVTVPSAAVLGPVRVGVTGTSGRSVGNQDRVFQIGIWADTPAHRDVIAQAIDPALRATAFVFMPDGTAGKLEYRGSPETDQFEKSTLYRRDLMYSVDYSTMQTVAAPQIVAVEVNISAAVDGVPPFVPVSTQFS